MTCFGVRRLSLIALCLACAPLVVWGQGAAPNPASVPLPADAPFTEVHERCSLSYVRRGSFGYRVRGRIHDLVAGAFVVGRCGDEYRLKSSR